MESVVGFKKKSFYGNEVAFVACLSLYRISKRDMVGTSMATSLASLVLKKILVGLVIHFHMI